MNTKSFHFSFQALFLPSTRLFYLAVFRVLLGIIILCKILFLWPNRKFLFGTKGVFEFPDTLATTFYFIPHAAVWEHLSLFYTLYAVAATLMVFGIGRRWTVAAVFIGTEIHHNLNWILLDGGDNLLQFSGLYLIFADSFSCLSLSKTPPARQEYTFSNFFTNIAVGAIIAHICLAYLVSGLSKAHAEVWYNGTAMYYILSADRFQGTRWNDFLANSALFNVVACYTTIVWETTFPFAVFVKKVRFWVLLMGVAMHLSIFALMMIQSFSFIFIFHYGFFFSDEEWVRFIGRSQLRLRSICHLIVKAAMFKGLRIGSSQREPIVYELACPRASDSNEQI